MKKYLLTFFVLMGLAMAKTDAQSFSTLADTVYLTVSGAGSARNNITTTGGSLVQLRWKVKNTTFPADWLESPAFGICDANLCYGNAAGQLWNTTTGEGDTFDCYYDAAKRNFYLVLNYEDVSPGTHHLTATIIDPATLYSKDITFIVTKIAPSNTPALSGTGEAIALFPNPAINEINLIYSANANIKNIAVYNILGKMMNVYKVSATSANINIESLPNGIYFVRLSNARGEVVVTKKFTKQ